MLNWVIHRPPEILNFQREAKLEQIIAIVTTHSVFLLVLIISVLIKKIPKNITNIMNFAIMQIISV